jgi:hypothetical protein
MSIRWFAWGFNVVAGRLADLRALPLWRGMQMRISAIKKILRPYVHLRRFPTQGRAKPLASQHWPNQRGSSKIDGRQ